MQIEINGARHKKDWLLCSAAGQRLLAMQKDCGVRPRCMCMPSGSEMYIATRGELHYLARMPGTAARHSANCESHLVPSKLYSADSAEKILSSLLKGISDIGGSKWNDLRALVLAASENITVDGDILKERLLIPTFFNKDHAIERRASYEKFVADGSGEDATQRRWLFAVIKEAAPSRFGARLSFKHMPGIAFWSVRAIAPRLLESVTDGVVAFGLFEVKKSSSGVLVVDCALHLVADHSDDHVTGKLPEMPPCPGNRRGNAG